MWTFWSIFYRFHLVSIRIEEKSYVVWWKNFSLKAIMCHLFWRTPCKPCLFGVCKLPWSALCAKLATTAFCNAFTRTARAALLLPNCHMQQLLHTTGWRRRMKHNCLLMKHHVTFSAVNIRLNSRGPLLVQNLTNAQRDRKLERAIDRLKRNRKQIIAIYFPSNCAAQNDFFFTEYFYKLKMKDSEL